MRRGVPVGRRIAILLVAALAAGFTYAAVEGSHQMVDRYARSTDCRTPEHLGIPYEAINYDRATDARFMSEPNPEQCVGPTEVELGDELVTSDGVRLAGWYVPAADGAADGPTVVLAHGWTGNKSGALDVLRLLHPTHDAVLFDFRNHGQSDGSQTTQGIREQRDLAAVLDWLIEHEQPSGIVVWGQSMGGHTTANLAAVDERIDAVILDSLHSRLRVPYALRAEEKGYPFGPLVAFAGMVGGFFRTGLNVWSAEPIDAIDDLGDRPVLLLRGEADWTIPASDTDELLAVALAAGVDARLETCPGSGHAELASICPDDYRTWVTSFLDEVGSHQ